MQGEALAKTCESAAARMFERFALTHEQLQPLREQIAHRTAFFRSDDPGLAKKVGIKLERDIRLHGVDQDSTTK